VIITNRGLVAELSTPLVDDDFPYECAASRYGNSSLKEEQSSPRCSGVCPAGHYCVTGAIEPAVCELGKYCPEGSTAGTNCPAGTFGSHFGLAAESDCSVCQAGTRCDVGSEVEAPCETGTYASEPGSANCTSCEAGSYQDRRRQTTCVRCPSGSFCEEGASTPSPCPAGTYSNATGLQRSNECLACPRGSWCMEGSNEPEPCASGYIGQYANLINQERCEACPTPTTSTAGSTVCNQCIATYFLVPGVGADAAAGDKCKSCETGITLSTSDGAGVEGARSTSTEDAAISCPTGTTLEGVQLGEGHWRLSATSRTVSKCRWSTDGKTTPCEGGDDAGVVGSTYCAANHTGPFCELCEVEEQYFDAEEAQCKDCPPTQNLIWLTLVALFMMATVLGFLALVLARPPRCLKWLSMWMHLAIIKVGRYALVPKFKILIAAFQCITMIPVVYQVSLPVEYHERMRTFTLIDFDWDQFFIPGACLPGGYFWRLMLRGIAPLVFIGVIFILGVLKEAISHCRKGDSVVDGARKGAFKMLPVMLFVLFCMCTSVSSSLFSAWNCVDVELSTSANASDGASSLEMKRFLRNDLSISCDIVDGVYTDRNYYQIVVGAGVLVAIWPVGVPLLYLLILVPNRHAILERRSTGATRATAFLHREYAPTLYFWESVFVLERLIVVGFVQWIGQPLIRLQFGLLVTLSYMTLQLYLRPFKRHDLDVLGIGAQLFLVGFFFGALNIKLHAELTNAEQTNVGLAKDVTGFSSAVELAGMIFILNMCNLGLFITTTLYQMATTAPVRTLRVAATRQPPDLSLDGDIKFHLFLSHTWNSGQDQVAVIKRQMQLLLPGIKVFLDVEDLENLEDLEMYVAQSQAVLLFYSRGYFFSENCLREVDEAIRLKKHLIVTHEADPQRGGVELAVIRADCESKDRDADLLFDQRTIIPWLRLAEFQLQSLKMIAEALVPTLPQYTTKVVERSLKMSQEHASTSDATAKALLYMPGELATAGLEFRHEVVLYASPHNPGAAEVAEELVDRYGDDNGKLRYIEHLKAERPRELRRSATTRPRNLSIDSEEVRNPDPRLTRGTSTGDVRMHLDHASPPPSPPPANHPALVRRESSRLSGLSASAADAGDALGRVARLVTRGGKGNGPEATHMLLYLNGSTFVGQNGAILAYEVRKARMAGRALLLVHECDTLRDGCGFDRFYQSTPQDLINTGLYKKLAVPLQPGAHRAISLALVARELGAAKTRSGIARTFSESSAKLRRMSQLSARMGSMGSSTSFGTSTNMAAVTADAQGNSPSYTKSTATRAIDRLPPSAGTARAYPTTLVVDQASAKAASSADMLGGPSSGAEENGAASDRRSSVGAAVGQRLSCADLGKEPTASHLSVLSPSAPGNLKGAGSASSISEMEKV